jgi:hypothetical protein
MTGVIATVGAAIDLCKKLRDLSTKIRDAELKNLIGDLSLNLADLKIQLADLQEENLRLKKDIAEMLQSTALRQKLAVRDGAYFLVEPQPGRADGPYCTRCFDVDGTLVLLSEFSGPFRRFGKYNCANCKGHFGEGS